LKLSVWRREPVSIVLCDEAFREQRAMVAGLSLVGSFVEAGRP
jgi:hypothetical protein